EAGLHLVDGKERAVSPAKLLRAFQIAGRRDVHSLSLHGLDEKERDLLGTERSVECVEVAERNRREPRQERPKAFDEMAIAARREGTEREPVEGLLRRDDARPAGRGAPELERRFDCLGARAREQDSRQSCGRPLQQLFGKESRQQRDAELDRSGSVELERLDKRRADPGIVPPGVEHPEAPEHVEETVPIRVVEVLPFGSRPHAIEADRLQHPHELWVDPARVEVVVLTDASFQELPDHERSVSPSKTVRAPQWGPSFLTKRQTCATSRDPCRHRRRCRGSHRRRSCRGFRHRATWRCCRDSTWCGSTWCGSTWCGSTCSGSRRRGSSCAAASASSASSSRDYWSSSYRPSWSKPSSRQQSWSSHMRRCCRRALCAPELREPRC